MTQRRPWALPLVPLYGAGLALKNGLRDRELGVRTLARPVVSVGSLSSGGAGKTPVVRALAALLERQGISCDVLTRGYGRIDRAVARVDPAGTAQMFGDEPLELARAGLAVYVGGDRYRAGLAAEHASRVDLHLLDDGFQHRQLARAFDLVLLTAEELEEALLPAGNRREPLGALARADAVLLREEEAAGLTAAVARHTAAEILTCRRSLHLPPAIPAAPLAFCALARPQGFFAMLRAAGHSLAGSIAFPDHAFYGPAELRTVLTAARAAGATGFVTTAKDAVKLSPEARVSLGTVGPVVTAELRVTFNDEQAILRRLSELVRA